MTTTTVELSEAESDWRCGLLFSPTTVTFYDGDAEKARKVIQDRVKSVVAANPWLLGRITKKRKDKFVQLTWERSPSADQVLCVMDPKPKSKRYTSASFSITTPYNEICKTLDKAGAIVPNGSKCLNKDELLTKMSVISTGPGSFAVVFSTSHITGDGYTHYTLLKMFGDPRRSASASSMSGGVSGDGGIWAMQPKRKFIDMAEQMGQQTKKNSEAMGITFNLVGNLLKRGTARTLAYDVDAERMKKLKEKAAVGVDFVSTNDVITSRFGTMHKARMFLMAVNLRNRIPGITDELAGNYTVQCCHTLESYSSPGGIRKMIQNGTPYSMMERETKKLGFREASKMRWGILSNWTNFFIDDLVVDGCSRKLHLPIMDLSTYIAELGIVFSPTPKHTAMLYFTKRLTPEVICGGDNFHGAPVSEAIFGAALPDKNKI